MMCSMDKLAWVVLCAMLVDEFVMKFINKFY